METRDDIASLLEAVQPALQAAVKAALQSAPTPADPVAFIADFLGRYTNQPTAPVKGAASPEPAAAAAARPESHATATAPSRRDDSWATAQWLSTLGDVNEAIAAGLLGPERPHDELAAMRALGAATPSEAALERRLRDAGALGALAKALHPALRRLAEAETATGAALHSKFVQEGGAFTMQYGDLSTFFGGLEAKIGPPRPKIEEGMKAEHTAASDSHDYFTTDNYGVATTPQLEWQFVADPGASIEWPVEEKLRGTPAKMRKPMPLVEMQAKLNKVNEQLDKLEEPRLLLVEAFGARLYTGPCFGACPHPGPCPTAIPPPAPLTTPPCSPREQSSTTIGFAALGLRSRGARTTCTRQRHSAPHQNTRRRLANAPLLAVQCEPRAATLRPRASQRDQQRDRQVLETHPGDEGVPRHRRRLASRSLLDSERAGREGRCGRIP